MRRRVHPPLSRITLLLLAPSTTVGTIAVISIQIIHLRRSRSHSNDTLSTAVSTNYEVLGGGGDFVLPPQYSLRYRNDEEFPLSTLDAISTFANDAPAGAEDAPTMP